jgi:hypothetical protein
MRIFASVGFVIALFTSCLGQNLTLLHNYDPATEIHKQNFHSFISSLRNKRTTDQRTVRRLFDKAHTSFLKNYKAYSQITDVFEKGNYDCLSGTYFLVKALEELGLQFKIFETNYHVFLTVETKRGKILLESTDKDNGFISNQKLIEEKITRYQQSKLNAAGTELYLSKLRIFHELLPSQLPGLLYFNSAVQSFNENQLSECCLYLQQAWNIYDNPRIEAFMPILIHSIEVSSLDSESKEKLIATLRLHQQSSAHQIASR